MRIRAGEYLTNSSDFDLFMSLSRPRRHGNLIRYNIVSHVSVDLEFNALGENNM